MLGKEFVPQFLHRLIGGQRFVLHHHIGVDPLFINGDSAGGEVQGGGQTQGRTILQGNDGLDRPLAEALGAYNQGSLLVFEGSGDNLGGRGAALIDEHHHGNVSHLAFLAGPGVKSHVLVAVAAFGVDDEAGA